MDYFFLKLGPLSNSQWMIHPFQIQTWVQNLVMSIVEVRWHMGLILPSLQQGFFFLGKHEGLYRNFCNIYIGYIKNCRSLSIANAWFKSCDDTLGAWVFKGVQHPLTLFLKTCVFSQNIKHLWTKYPLIMLIWLAMFQGTKKSQFYFSRNIGCEVRVHNVWKSIFSLFWSINQ